MRYLRTILLALALPVAALAGTTNIPGRLIIQTDDSAPTCSTATGDGMLCVESAVELQSTCAITGNTTIGGTLAVTGATTFSALTSDAANPADSEAIRLGNTQCIAWESDPAGVDKTLCVNADEQLVYQGTVYANRTGGGIIVIADSSVPGDANGAGQITFRSYSDASAEVNMARVQMDVTSAASGAEDAELNLLAMENGTLTEYVSLDPNTGIVALSRGLAHHNGTALPATCTVGQVFLDTDSDDCANSGGGDGCLCICKSANTWAIVINI